jgi:serine/threonine-protein kinase RsbW
MPTKKILGRFKNLAQIGEFVTVFAQQAGLDNGSAYQVQLAVDEACSNIIEHGYGGEGKGEIHITCMDIGEGIKIIVRDWGKSFDPLSIEDPDVDVPLEELKMRGAGLFFMRNIMDEVKFDFDMSEGNVLTMVKRK